MLLFQFTEDSGCAIIVVFIIFSTADNCFVLLVLSVQRETKKN